MDPSLRAAAQMLRQWQLESRRPPTLDDMPPATRQRFAVELAAMSNPLKAAFNELLADAFFMNL